MYNLWNLILFSELPELNTPVIFPKHVELQTPHEFNFNDLDYRTQQELTEMCDQDIITFFELPGKNILNRIVSTACKKKSLCKASFLLDIYMLLC